MEERVHQQPPPPSTNDDPRIPIRLVLADGTYIVQMPKDQIYWVPPPDNSDNIERRHPTPQKERRCTPCAFYTATTLIIVGVLATIITIIYKTTLIPKYPIFMIKHFYVKEYPNPESSLDGDHHAPPLYHVEVQVINPNAMVSMAYLSGPAELELDEREVARGSTPAVRQAVKGINKFEVELLGRVGIVPKAIEETVKPSRGRDGAGKRSVGMSFKMSLPMRKKTWLMMEKDLVIVKCGFVVGSMGHGEDASVISQRCDCS